MAARKKLPTGITLTPTGRYMVRPYDRDTKKKGKARTFTALSEAVAYKEKIDAGKIKPASRDYTVDEWVEKWTTDPGFKRAKQSTNLHNKERVRKLAEDFKGVPMHQIDRATARTWGLENKHRVPAVRAMFTDARLDGVIDANPFEQLRISKTAGRKHIEALTEKEVRELAKIADKKWPDWPVMSAMIVFSAYSGLRLGEMLALRWADIDWENGLIRVDRQWSQKARTYTPPKSGLTRVVALLAPAADALRRVDRNLGAHDLVWYSRRGKRIEPSLHDYYWRQVVNTFNERAGEDRAAALDLEWHGLRHFTASLLVDKGAQPHDIAGQLGHTDGGKLVQELYGHLYTDNSISRIQAVMAA